MPRHALRASKLEMIGMEYARAETRVHHRRTDARTPDDACGAGVPLMQINRNCISANNCNCPRRLRLSRLGFSQQKAKDSRFFAIFSKGLRQPRRDER